MVRVRMIEPGEAPLQLRARAPRTPGSRRGRSGTAAPRRWSWCWAARTRRRSTPPTAISAPQHSSGKVSTPCARMASSAAAVIVVRGAHARRSSVLPFPEPLGQIARAAVGKHRDDHALADALPATSRQAASAAPLDTPTSMPFFPRQPPRQVVRLARSTRARPRRPAADRRCRARWPSPCASALRRRAAASRAAPRSAGCRGCARAAAGRRR